MAQASGMSLVGCQATAALMKTDLENAVVRLFKSDFHPTPQNVLADFEANECDYDGYASETIVAWGAIVLASGGVGYVVQGVFLEYLWALAVDAVGNSVGGWWVETAGGSLRNFFEFSQSVPMTGPGMSVSFVPAVPVFSGFVTGV